MMEPKLRVLSLGVGVQSTTLLRMASHGEIKPMPDLAIVADTGWERLAFYEQLSQLQSENAVSFPIEVVSGGSLHDDALAQALGVARPGGRPQPPFFVKNKDGSSGIVSRQCTREYKIKPIIGELRRRLEISARYRGSDVLVEQWIGISTDEAVRMKPSQYNWIKHRWPLIELRMSRGDCIEWLARHGYPIPQRSSCIGCPFHSDTEWRALTPQEFSQAVDFERAVQAGARHFGLRGVPFLHRSCIPLGEVDFSTAEDHGQMNLFGNECEGMCGV